MKTEVVTILHKINLEIFDWVQAEQLYSQKLLSPFSMNFSNSKAFEVYLFMAIFWAKRHQFGNLASGFFFTLFKNFDNFLKL